jgi:hypothetical protein
VTFACCPHKVTNRFFCAGDGFLNETFSGGGAERRFFCVDRAGKRFVCATDLLRGRTAADSRYGADPKDGRQLA